jgi:hypothetical protein
MVGRRVVCCLSVTQNTQRFSLQSSCTGKKTGLFIDQYSDLKLSSGVKPLIESLEAKDNGSSIYGLLLTVLRKSEADGYGIIFVGD